MNIEINSQLMWESWDPVIAAGLIGMVADIRAENITPDRNRHIIIKISATGANEAIFQVLEIE